MKGAADYAYRFDQFAALAFAAKRVDEVTAYDLAAWRDDQAATLKPATVVRKLAMLSAIFTWCMKERGWLKVNPLALVAKPRVSDGRDRLMSADEQGYLLAAAGSSKATWLPSALVLLMHSAMRRGEAFALRRQDVDYSAAIAQLHDTKNGRPRKVPLCPKSLEALRWLDAAADARGDEVLLPLGTVGSISMRFTHTVRRARQSYEDDCAASGRTCDPRFLADLRLHDLRHHACSLWANRGLPMLELMAISGHLNPRQLARYAHINSSTLAGKLATLTEQASVSLAVAC
jgi:integrase